MKSCVPLLGLVLASSFFGSCSRRDLVTIKGSDTMLEAALAWSEAYGKFHPEVKLSVSGTGSGPGINALIAGTVDIANASRKMTAEEIAKADQQGHHPVEFHVGNDAIAIYVNKDNPIASITFDQLAGIYQKDAVITKWSQLGVTLPGGDDQIVVLSRQNNSGTYEYFKEAVLHKGDFKLDVLSPNGSTELVNQVAASRSAIGYCGLAYANDKVKLVPVAKKSGEPPVMPSIDSAIDHSYPISRPLFMYSGGEPRPEVKQYIDWILSDDGQRVLAGAHYPPLRKLQ